MTTRLGLRIPVAVEQDDSVRSLQVPQIGFLCTGRLAANAGRSGIDSAQHIEARLLLLARSVSLSGRFPRNKNEVRKGHASGWPVTAMLRTYYGIIVVAVQMKLLQPNACRSPATTNKWATNTVTTCSLGSGPSHQLSLSAA